MSLREDRVGDCTSRYRVAAGNDQGLRVLVDGPDLSGKTTLVEAVSARLRARGWTVQANKGGRDDRWRVRTIARISPNKHPDSALLNSAYIAQALLDHLRDRPVPKNTIIITEGYVDRSIAYGIARGLGWPAQLALRVRDIFPRFNLAILVKADLATRKARLAQRNAPSRIDRRSIESHHRFLAAYRLVFRRHRRRIIIDTSRVGIDEAVDVALQHILDVAGYRPVQAGSEVLVSAAVSRPLVHLDALIPDGQLPPHLSAANRKNK
ncbi:thymidylate kinase [Bradyrhizobium sp. AZCC 1678]|uniref:hypothetical protein n=1 Tax=Bradyrhizobium sp. AZCC 1678 TaxID=3117030 RepID=UPI002FF0607B